MNRSTFKFPSPAETMHFDGERYTSGIEGPIQHEHYHRYLFALNYCSNKNVLDVASGEGYGSFLLGQVANTVIGVDIDQKAVDFANRNCMSERVSYRQGDAAKLPIEDQSVDVVVSFETIEHFDRQTDFIMEIDRVLRPGGVLIMSSPNREIYSEAQDYQNPFHVHEMNRQEFVDLLRLRFPHIHLLEQGAVLGSLILSLSQDESGDIEGFTTRDGRLYERQNGVPGAPYFIAVATRTPIAPPSQSVLHADFFREQVERRVAAIEQARAEQAEGHALHARRMGDVEAALRADLASCQGLLADAALREQAAAEHMQSMIALHGEQIAQARASLDALHGHVAYQDHAAAQREQSAAALHAAQVEEMQSALDAANERSLSQAQAGAEHQQSSAALHAAQIEEMQSALDAANERLLSQAQAAAEREQSMAALHATQIKQMRSVTRLLHERLATQQRDAASPAPADAGQAEQIEPLRAAVNMLLERVASQEEAAARHDQQVASAHAEQIAALRAEQAQAWRLHEKLMRRLGSTLAVDDTGRLRQFRTIARLMLKGRTRLLDRYRRLASSPLLDRRWYLAQNPDVSAKHFDPVLHYLLFGSIEGRQPGPLFDTQQYALANPDVAAAKADPLLHFIDYGVREMRALKPEGPPLRSALPLRPAMPPLPDLSPLTNPAVQQTAENPDFDAAFLGPFYAAAGQADDPSQVFRHLSATGVILPATRERADALANAIRHSRFFDAQSYGRRLPPGMDPALHYVVIGERLGWAASESFDAQFYLDSYPDIKAGRIYPLAHFQDHGAAEGRRGAPSARRLNFAPLLDVRRPILVICHEASRTGAPILGWNLIRDLRKRHPVVTVLMRGGALEEDFAAESDVVIGPLTYAEWDASEMAFVAERLVEAYRPLYAIANSVVTSPIVPPLSALGVPCVALVHEFASYTRPLQWMRPPLDWAPHIVFPARIVAQSAFDSFPGFEQRRGVHVLAQGRQLLPNPRDGDIKTDDLDVGELMRSADEAEAFIVLGAGTVQLRKGVDLFISVAAAARRLAPEVRFKFIWVGDGYNPEEDASYSVYLREQINKSDLQDTVVFLEPVADFEPAYRTADVFLMSSRLDPQPNVGIDAVTLGLPVVCFEGACGTGEILAADAETRALVVPHLDVDAAAREICRLARDPLLLEAMGQAVKRVGRVAYSGETYVAQLDAWGREAADALSPIDLDILRASGAVEPELTFPPHPGFVVPKSASAEQIVLMQWAATGLSHDQHRNSYFRRGISGFHPQAYAAAHAEDCSPGGQNPAAHWLQRGRPQGPWAHSVFSPSDPPSGPREKLRVALHAHFYYPDLAAELAGRLKANRWPCDLFISTDTEAKAEALRLAFEDHPGMVTVRVMPNQGRDIGPLLTGFADEVASGEYDVWGHVHSKKSSWSDAGIGDSWRTFLWENLIGGKDPMMDIGLAAFASDPGLGLLFAEDPHLMGWDDNRENAQALAARMGISSELPEFFDFPLGTMFWFRPKALSPLLALGLDWDDYPEEPLPYDGSLLHTLERLIPVIATSQSFGLATLRAPRTYW